MTYDAMKAMLAGIDDPNTRFLEPAQRQLVVDALAGKYHGIGAILGVNRIKSGTLTQEHLIVITPVQSGPAAEAGLKAGDDIVAIDGKAVLPFDLRRNAMLLLKDKTKDSGELRKQLKVEQQRIKTGVPILDAENTLISDDKKEVELSISRKGSARPLTIKVTPHEFTVKPVTSQFDADSKLGYVRINCFSSGTAEEFAKALKDMASAGANGLVLDMRNLAGGEVDQVLQVAKYVAPGKTLGTELQSHGRKSVIKIPSTQDAWQKPMAVFVNAGTARMPELLASALQEECSAKLVGERTYGDASYATLTQLDDGSAVMMTTGAFLTSSGKDYSGKGLRVDLQAASASTGDPQLSAATRLLSTQGGKS